MPVVPLCIPLGVPVRLATIRPEGQDIGRTELVRYGPFEPSYAGERTTENRGGR